MAIFVACNIPNGFVVGEGGATINLNGAHVGLNVEDLPKNGVLNDSPDRIGSYGVTKLEGSQEDAFLAWAKAVTEKAEGAPVTWQPFAPIENGAIRWEKSEADLRKSIMSDGTDGIGGLTDKDLPAGLEPADTNKKK